MTDPATVAFAHGAPGVLTIRLAGAWHLDAPSPIGADPAQQLQNAPGVERVVFDVSGLTDWDSALATYVQRVLAACQARAIAVDQAGLPPGLRRLLALAEAVPERQDTGAARAEPPFLERVGISTIALGDGVITGLDFLGQVVQGFGRLARGKARFRRVDLGVITAQVTLQALPVVTLVNFLVGLILAFVGAAQLEQFGAAIFVANLVGVAMVRDMAAIMTSIVMAGRSGAAFAAQLATMNASQEVDALTTTGIPPMDFLVVPRVLALTVALPLLTLYADLVGILGGAVVGVTMLDLTMEGFLRQTYQAVQIKHLLGGIFKATVYGGLVAMAGCLRGLQSGRSAAAVGEATTSAVVTSIVLIIGAAGLFAYLFYVLGL